jgi:tetrahydromethanopterin S-methyltransferase subunit G
MPTSKANTTTSPKKSKTNPLLNSLLQAELAGTDGIALCAHNALRDSVRAFKYNAKGEVKESDAWVRELRQYLAETRRETFRVPKGGKSKAVVEATVTFYTLSPTGQAFLANQREEEQEKLMEEARKKAEEIAGIQAALKEYEDAVKTLAESVHSLPLQNKAGQPAAAEFGDLQKQMAQKLDEFKKNVQEQLDRLHQQVAQKMEKVQEQVGQQVSQDIGKIAQAMEAMKTELSQQVVSLEQKIAGKVSQTTGEMQQLQSQIRDIKSKSEAWTEAVRQSPLLQSQQVASPAAGLVRSAPAHAASQGTLSLGEFEARVIAKLMPLIPHETTKSIDTLYQGLRQQGISIRPGHLNDLLWELHQQRKVELQLWIKLLCDLPRFEHAIFRPDAKVYAYVQRRKE